MTAGQLHLEFFVLPHLRPLRLLLELFFHQWPLDDTLFESVEEARSSTAESRGR
jgi:hypothetical protein